MKIKVLSIVNFGAITMLLITILYTLNKILSLFSTENDYNDLRENIIRIFILFTIFAIISLSTFFYCIFKHILKKEKDKFCIDGQTKFFNKPRMWQDIESISSKGIAFSVIYMDIDNLKKINDEYGHMAGDKLIEKFTFNILKINNKALCYRFGGDEFIVIVKEKDLDFDNYINEILKINNIVFDIIDECTGKKVIINIEFSMGISNTLKDGYDPKTLIELADERMYSDKKKRKQM